MFRMAHSQRFCVIAQARTGSEYLTTRLNEHPEITCHRELYNPHALYSALTGEFKTRLPSTEERDADPLAALEKVAALSDEAFPDKRLFGFKLFLKHDEAVRLHVRDDERYRLIVLERSNKLAQYVSTEMARETGQWTARVNKQGERKVKNKPGKSGKSGKSDAAADEPTIIDVDLEHLARYIQLSKKRYKNFMQRLEGRAGVMHLRSEEIDARFAEVLEFLGVDVSPELRVVRARQNPTPLSTRVSNWDAVTAWLDQHGHAEWATTA